MPEVTTLLDNCATELSMQSFPTILPHKFWGRTSLDFFNGTFIKTFAI